MIDSYIKPLTLLINHSFSVGSFTDELKLANIIPIYKSGSSMELHNYRPISVLTTFFKIQIEHLFFKVLLYGTLLKISTLMYHLFALNTH